MLKFLLVLNHKEFLRRYRCLQITIFCYSLLKYRRSTFNIFWIQFTKTYQNFSSKIYKHITISNHLIIFYFSFNFYEIFITSILFFILRVCFKIMSINSYLIHTLDQRGFNTLNKISITLHKTILKQPE